MSIAPSEGHNAVNDTAQVLKLHLSVLKLDV